MTPLFWFQDKEYILIELGLLAQTNKNAKMIQERLKTSSNRQKSYEN